MNTLLTPEWLAKEVVDVMIAKLAVQTTYIPSVNGVDLGTTVFGVEMTNQPFVRLNVQTNVPADDETIDDYRARYVRPAGETLAWAIEARGMTVLSDLPLVTDGARVIRVTSEEKGVSVRGTFTPNPETGKDDVVFDVIGGHA